MAQYHGVAVVVIALCLVAGCAPRKRVAPTAPSAPAAPALSETPLPASGTAMFAIGQIEDHRCEDRIFVEGTVQNTGSRASKDVKVWVEGLDAGGAVVAKDEAMPVPQEIAAGSRGRFIVKLPNDPAIRTFHVEAIGR